MRGLNIMNVEFEWDPEHPSSKPPLQSPHIPVTYGMVKKAMSMMKSGKTAGPTGIVVEIIKAAGDKVTIMTRDLATAIIPR